MPRKPPGLFNVHKVQDGSQIVTGVDLGTARDEKARLNAEAAVINSDTGLPTGMTFGEVSRYEVRTPEGLVI